MEKKEDKPVIQIDTTRIPNVLLLGSGMIRLGEGGMGWEDLLEKIRSRTEMSKIGCVPLAMQPEVLCGVNVNDIQKRIAETIVTCTKPHDLLKEILALPFDAILTTNYTYEIESILSYKAWNKNARKEAFTALDGAVGAHKNTHICNAVRTSDGRVVLVFHLHGEIARKRSLILNYYSYADSVSRLVTYNKKLANNIYEHQRKDKLLTCKSWLDFFILGNVWSLGLSLNVSEFDLWWAIERKAREKNAMHGLLHVFLEGNEDDESPQKLLLNAMNSMCSFVEVVDYDYETYYSKIITQIREEIS